MEREESGNSQKLSMENVGEKVKIIGQQINIISDDGEDFLEHCGGNKEDQLCLLNTPTLNSLL